MFTQSTNFLNETNCKNDSVKSSYFGNQACFVTSVPCFKRPRPSQISSFHRSKYFPILTKQNRARKGTNHQLCMTSKGSLANTNPGNSDLTNSQSILPRGACTIILKVKLRSEFSDADKKALLAEYARKTCAEPRVLRCDVLYEVSSIGRAKNNYYSIWITFNDPRGYLEHEKTPHATKLRVCLENPSGGDNSKMLTKLSHDVFIGKPVHPDAESWRSCLDFSVYEDNHSTPLFQKSASHLLSNAQEKKSQGDIVRKSLDALISSVGLENVVVLVAKASAKSMEDMRSLRKTCQTYVQDLEKSPGTVRTGILVESQDPNKVFVLTVHDGGHEDGACFDMELGENYISDEGWQVLRNYAVFPDKIGWEKRVDSMDEVNYSNSTNFLVAPPEDAETKNDQLAPVSGTPTSSDVKCRLLQGPGAFDKIKECLRKMSKKPVGDVQVMIICGWNQSRTASVLVELDNETPEDTGKFKYGYGTNVYSCNLTTKCLRDQLEVFDKVQPDVIIGYGGGTVMDMTKALGRLGNSSPAERDEYLNMIDKSAETNDCCIDIEVRASPIPVLLIPSIVGSGAAVTELMVFCARNKGSQNRLSVKFMDPPGTTRFATEKTMIFDSRIFSPKRVDGHIASQGALELVCLAIDTLLCEAELQRNSQVESFAKKGISEAFRSILPALQEPSYGFGLARDSLCSAELAVGLANDAIGRLGPLVVLTLAILDSLVDGRSPFVFRQVLIRVTAAFLQELCRADFQQLALPLWTTIRSSITIPNNESLSRILLQRAEDADVPLLHRVGFVKRCIEHVVERVVHKGSLIVASPLEKEFYNAERLERVVKSACAQSYEL